MAQFMKNHGISDAIENLIRNANRKLVLISPYWQLSDLIKRTLQTKARDGLLEQAVFLADGLSSNRYFHPITARCPCSGKHRRRLLFFFEGRTMNTQATGEIRPNFNHRATYYPNNPLDIYELIDGIEKVTNRADSMVGKID